MVMDLKKHNKKIADLIGSLGILIVSMGILATTVLFLPVDIATTDLPEISYSNQTRMNRKSSRTSTKLIDLPEKKTNIRKNTNAKVLAELNIKRQTPPPSVHVTTAVKSGSETTLEQAMEMVDNDRPEEAIALLNRILEDDPNNIEVLEELGLIQLDVYDNPEEAMRYFVSVLEKDPENHAIAEEMIGVYMDLETLDEGLVNFQRLADQHPESRVIAKALGEIYYTKGKTAEAIPHLERAINSSNDETLPNDHYMLAKAYSRSGRHRQSIGQYKKVLSFQEREIEELQARGYPYERIRKMRRRTQLELAASLIENKQFTDARSLLEKVQRDDPQITGRDGDHVRQLLATLEQKDQ